MSRFLRSFAWAGAAIFAAATTASAQEPINAADSATQPSPGHAIFMEQVRFLRLDLDETRWDQRGDVDDVIFLSTLNVGVKSNLSLSLRFPILFRDREFDADDSSEREEGIGDVTVLAKWRFLQLDTSPLDTLRVSLIGGAQIRTGDSPFTTDGYNPILGLAMTKIGGRHGFNGSLEWTFTTVGNEEPVYAGESTADLFRYDLAYLFRMWPKAYEADTPGAWYAVCELNGLYETNGDNELFLSPGLMYEATTWTAELSFQWPAWQRIEHRAEAEFAVVAGVRFSF